MLGRADGRGSCFGQGCCFDLHRLTAQMHGRDRGHPTLLWLECFDAAGPRSTMVVTRPHCDEAGSLVLSRSPVAAAAAVVTLVRAPVQDGSCRQSGLAGVAKVFEPGGAQACCSPASWGSFVTPGTWSAGRGRRGQRGQQGHRREPRCRKSSCKTGLAATTRRRAGGQGRCSSSCLQLQSRH